VTRYQSVLITGAAGWSGRHLVAHLREKEPSARVLGTDLRSATLAHGLPFEHCDLTQPGALDALLARERPGAIAHLAAELAEDSGERLWRVNVGATVGLLESVLAVPDYRPRVLLVGSAAEYAADERPLDERAPKRPTTLYGLSKLAQTQIGLAYASTRGLDVVVARPFNLLGPDVPDALAPGAFARGIAERLAGQDAGPLEVGDLDASRDFLDVRDAVAAYALLLHKGRCSCEYNVCSGRATPLRTILDAMLERAGGRVSVRSSHDPDRPSRLRVSVGSAELLRAETSWRPCIPLDQSIADTLDSYLHASDG
jgi:GDP-4-dehydro-6-deoxy-D-mannose reductase